MAPVTRSVQYLIEKSLQTIGVLAAGETVDADDLADSFEVFQDMVQELSSDSFFIPFYTWIPIPMTADQGAYTLGEYTLIAPDVEMVRPEQIIEAFYRDSGHNDTPVSVISAESWASISGKYTTNHSSGRPTFLWYDTQVPNGRIYLEPWPDDSSAYLFVLSTQPMIDAASFSLDMVNVLFIPRNYHNALRYMLSVELCPLFGRPLDPIVASKAGSGYERIIGLNAARRVKAANFEIPGGADAGSRGTTIFNS